jgi:hypothetical protein
MFLLRALKGQIDQGLLAAVLGCHEFKTTIMQAVRKPWTTGAVAWKGRAGPRHSSVSPSWQSARMRHDIDCRCHHIAEVSRSQPVLYRWFEIAGALLLLDASTAAPPSLVSQKKVCAVLVACRLFAMVLALASSTVCSGQGSGAA